MVVSAGNFIRPYYPSTRIHHYLAQAGSTYVPGTPVSKVTATDEVLEATADPASIVGFAAEAAPPAGVKGAVYMADEENEFVGHVQDAATPTNANIGIDYGIVKDVSVTPPIWRVDLSEAVATLCHITQVLDPGVVNGRVVFKILNAKRKILSS